MCRPALCLQLALGLLACAAAFGGPPGEPWKLDHLLPEDGLASPTVYSLLQDRVGFLWLGTEGGLQRFDGHAFESFRHDPNDPASLASDDISFMLEDSAGLIWLATWGGGLDLLDPVAESFRHYRGTPRGAGPEGEPGGLQDDRVQHLWEDSGGDLWIGTFSGGLSRFDRDRESFETYRHDPGDPTSLCHDRVWRILEDPSGSLWIGTGKGLCLLDREEGTFRRFRHAPGDPSSLSDDIVRTLYLDSSGVLWVGTAGGLNRFDGETETFERLPAAPHGLSHDVVTALFEDSRGALWVGTRGGGLNVLDRATGHWQTLRRDPTDPGSLSDDDVRALLEDRSGLLWIATRQGGVNKLDLNPAKFEHVGSSPADPGGLSSGRVRALAEGPAGRLWIGTAEGVELRDPATDRYTRFQQGGGPGTLPSNDVHRLLIDSAGDLWVAAGRSGLHRMASGQAGFVSYRHDPEDPESLGDDLVTALHEDRSGTLWIGTVSGLDRLVPSSSGRPRFEHYRHRPEDTSSLSEGFITVLYEDSERGFWIGTHNGGLNRRPAGGQPPGGRPPGGRPPGGRPPGNGRFERFLSDPRNPESLSNNRVFAIHQPTAGEPGGEASGIDETLWIGTANGLNARRPNGSFRRYLEEDGLPHPQISAILDDGRGGLWLATGDGLSRFDPPTGTFRNYAAGDGLQEGPYNVGAALARRDGSLCFGGNEGYDCLDPRRVADHPFSAPVVLTGFTKLGEEHRFGRAPWTVDRIRLSHAENFFAFEFAALDFTRPEDNRYRYKLEGFDRAWVDAGPRRLASYTNVTPGDYVFRVQGSNSDAVWSKHELAVDLSITPPLWRTWWFRSLAALALLSTGAGVYHLRIQTLTRREQQLARRVEDGLTDLRRSEERYRLLFERNLAGVVRADVGGTVIDCNEAFARILGYESPRQCQDQHRLDLDESPDTRPSLLARLRQDGAVAGHEAAVRTRDGAMVTLLWNANLVAGEDGEGAVVEGTVIDVSERLRIEEGLRRAQKLESMGVLAGGIAHDFNNLLMGILGNAELSRMGLDPDSKIHHRLEQIEAAAQRAAELSKQMLAYSGKGEFVVNRLDLSQAVTDMAHLLEGAVSKKARLVCELAPDLPAIEADAGQIEQIVMSLVTNASEALSSNGGTITVASGSRHFGPRDLAETYLDDQLPAGSYVFLRVTDDGCGMDEDLQRKIFDPFFTTKFTGRGLGLAAVLGIVRGHHGAIRIDSAPGEGSTFTVLFPAAALAPAAAERPAEAPEAPELEMGNGGGTILVVDDDRSVRLVVHDMVAALGFDVLTAADGQEGLEVFRRCRDDVTLVILDLAMPRMSGEEAFREIRAISPEVRVILASGYEESESIRLFAGQGLSGFIQKPYRFKVLKQKIQEALNGT